MRGTRARILAGLAALAVALAASPARAGVTFQNFDFQAASAGAGGTTANGINNKGAIVGFGTNAAGTALTNFVRNPDGSFTTLSKVDSSNATAMANGINNGPVVVGASNGSAFMLTNNGQTFTALPAVNGTTTSEAAFGINDKGTIVGQYTDSSTGTTPGFVYNNGTYTTLNPVSPVKGVLVVNAQGINNNGLVTGFYSTDNTTTPVDGNEPQHGFFYDTTTKSFILPKDPNQPNFFTVQLLGINDSGLAAGYWQDKAGDQFGLLYNVNTQAYTFLNDPLALPNTNGIVTTQITGINDSDTITGFYLDANGLSHGFVASVPEPGTLTLFGIGVLAALGYAYRRRKQLAA